MLQNSKFKIQNTWYGTEKLITRYSLHEINLRAIQNSSRFNEQIFPNFLLANPSQHLATSILHLSRRSKRDKGQIDPMERHGSRQVLDTSRESKANDTVHNKQNELKKYYIRRKQQKRLFFW
jgi:hypothetical protein